MHCTLYNQQCTIYTVYIGGGTHKKCTLDFKVKPETQDYFSENIKRCRVPNAAQPAVNVSVTCSMMASLTVVKVSYFTKLHKPGPGVLCAVLCVVKCTLYRRLRGTSVLPPLRNLVIFVQTFLVGLQRMVEDFPEKYIDVYFVKLLRFSNF